MLSIGQEIVSDLTRCPCCGKTDFSWKTANTITGDVQPNNVKCIFYLGCDNCSETLETISTDKLAGIMTKQMNLSAAEVEVTGQKNVPTTEQMNEPSVS